MQGKAALPKARSLAREEGFGGFWGLGCWGLWGTSYWVLGFMICVLGFKGLNFGFECLGLWALPHRHMS